MKSEIHGSHGFVAEIPIPWETFTVFIKKADLLNQMGSKIMNFNKLF